MSALSTLSHPAGFETVRYIADRATRTYTVVCTGRVLDRVYQQVGEMDQADAERHHAELVAQGYRIG